MAPLARARRSGIVQPALWIKRLAPDTSGINIAIKAASSAGGGRVLFPPGTYLTGCFELLSNVQLE
jgi:hypothetical protein